MKITTTGPVKHDGKDIEIGDTLDLAPRQARDLIFAGAAEPYSKVKVDKVDGDEQSDK